MDVGAGSRTSVSCIISMDDDSSVGTLQALYPSSRAIFWDTTTRYAANWNTWPIGAMPVLNKHPYALSRKRYFRACKTIGKGLAYFLSILKWPWTTTPRSAPCATQSLGAKIIMALAAFGAAHLAGKPVYRAPNGAAVGPQSSALVGHLSRCLCRQWRKAAIESVAFPALGYG